MELIQQFFVDIFIKLYPYLHNHFVSYLLFLIILGVIIKQTFNLIKRSKKSKFRRYVLVSLQCFLISYMAWYVLVFFHTYQNIGKTKFQSVNQEETSN